MRGLIMTACGVLGAGVLVFGTPSATGYDITSHPFAGDQQQQQPPPNPQRPTEVLLETVGGGTGPKLGIQAFTGNAGEAVRTIEQVLWNDLDYEREYQMISRKATASIPPAAAPTGLPFDVWKEAGAFYVMMGSVQDTGGKLTVEIRIVNVASDQGTIKFAQRYDGCTTASVRFCAHHIADDIHKKEMNLEGVARTRIAFTSDRAGEQLPGRPTQDATVGKEIYLMDYDGARQQRMTSTRSLNVAPTWGTDGRTLAYTSYVSSYPDVYVSTMDGRPVQRPARGTERAHNWDPEISPDGTQVAFTSNRSGHPGYPDIWVMNRDGSNLRNLTPTPTSAEGAPTWSPGGNQIAFTSDRTGLNQIFVMNADGTGVRRMTFDKQVDRPTWSSKGFIAYTLRQPSGHDIARLDLARSEPRVITDGRGSNTQPTVAPNGRHIIFVTTRWGKQHLASVDLDGKNIRQLTEVGNNTHPSWSPSPGGR